MEAREGGNLATEESCGHAGRMFKKNLIKTHREKIPLSHLFNGTVHECAWCCNNSCPGRLCKWDGTGWNWFPMHLEEVTERERVGMRACRGLQVFVALNNFPPLKARPCCRAGDRSELCCCLRSHALTFICSLSVPSGKQL